MRCTDFFSYRSFTVCAGSGGRCITAKKHGNERVVRVKATMDKTDSTTKRDVLSLSLAALAAFTSSNIAFPARYDCSTLLREGDKLGCPGEKI